MTHPTQSGKAGPWKYGDKWSLLPVVYGTSSRTDGPDGPYLPKEEECDADS